MGRPFIGEVEESGKEPNVPERRSILRGFKKFYAKKDSGSCVEYLEEILGGVSVQDRKDLEHFMKVCKKTQSMEHYKKKPADYGDQEEEKAALPHTKTFLVSNQNILT